jgi:hypothetical protein
MATPTRTLLYFAGILVCCSAAWAKITIGTLSVEREALPNETYEGTIIVTNDGDEAARVSIYQTDYLCFSDGSNQYGEPGKMPRSNAPWISYNPRQTEVPPHQQSAVSYVVKVPENPALNGTYWSILMVEELQDPRDMPIPEPDRQTVRQVLRYGVQCITHIRDTGQPKVQFLGTKLVPVDPQLTELQVDVENTGERWIVPTPYVELFDMAGHPAGRFESQKKRIFPGASVRFQISLGATPGGKYKALIVLDNGDQQLFGAKYDLEF